MYRKIVWCYIIILTLLLDISLNTKLSAQGKSHGAGISIHDSLVEGITFTEWGKDAQGRDGGSGARAPLRLEPASLSFGERSLGAAHAATVTLTNTANTTLHLASVAGTTPDFHASFFESKTVPPDGNTTFSVVYLGRREGPVSAHLYIHTALGVHKYSVSAEGVASEWGVWPLLGLRVPANASLEPMLTLRNPTDHPVQVSEVYSSGGWVRLSLPGGAAQAAREAWLVPAHAARDIVRLAISPPHAHAATATAYIRIKANITGGGLIVGVEARGAPAGEFADPPQLRLRARGHRDPPETFSISVGSSAGAGARLEGAVWGARCGHAPAAADPAPPNKHMQNGVKAEGAHVSLLRSHLDPYQELTKAAQLTLDYERLWAGYVNGASEVSNGNGDGGGAKGGAGGGGGAWCEGVVRLGRASLPYSLRLLPGTLALPPYIDFVTADREQAAKEVELVATNEFLVPVEVTHVHVPPAARALLAVRGAGARVLAPGARATLLALQLTGAGADATLQAELRVHTNVTDYTVPLRIYSGKLELEWEWPWAAQGVLELGALSTSSTRRVRGSVRNPAPRAQCVTAARTDLPGASLALSLAHCASELQCRCIEAGGSAPAVLTVVAPARAGALRGALWVSTPHARAEHAVTLSAHQGRLAAAPLSLKDHAPYSWSWTSVAVESSMPLRMEVRGVWGGGGGGGRDAAVRWEGGGEQLAPGRSAAGSLAYCAERLCAPRCYTGLDIHTTEGAAWLSAGAAWAGADAEARAAARRADRALLDARRALYRPATANISLHLTTTQVALIPVTGLVELRWPRLVATADGGGAGWAGLAGVGGAAALRVAVRNPSRSHALLLQAALGPPPDGALPDVWEGAECGACAREPCAPAPDAFSLDEWRVLRGAARQWAAADPHNSPEPRPAEGESSRLALPMLLLEPGAEIEVKLTFAPKEPSALAAYLYLRNNLTIVEGVQVAGRGAVPSFELAGRRAGAAAPLLFEVTDCGGGGVVRRAVVARNTGAVAVRLRDWRVAAAPCAARGFALQPCAPLALQPNQSAPLTLSYTPDYTLARAHATLRLRTDHATHAFRLLALTPPRLLARCARLAPRPPWEPALRSAAQLLSLALLALLLAAAALDAERLLRRARAARAARAAPAAQQPAPLDLRAAAAPPAPPAPARPAPPPPPPPRRRKTRKVDPQAEAKAFERWRASLRRPDDNDDNDDERSSEDAEHEPDEPRAERAETPPPPPRAAYEPAAEPRAASSGDDSPPSSESESSSPPSLDGEPSPDEEPARAGAGPGAREAARPARAPAAPAGEAARRRAEARARGERRAGDEAARRGPGGKQAARRDKPGKRRERAPPTPPRVEPPLEPRTNTGGVRWGASWSSVVARSASAGAPGTGAGPGVGAGLGGAGGGVTARRERDAPRQDNSLFYFNGEAAALRPDPDYAWRPHEQAFATPTHTRDFLDDPVGGVGVGVGGVSSVSVGGVGGVGGVGNTYGSIGPVWGSSLEARAPGAAWPWPSYNNTSTGPVRPPPGFGTSPGGVGGVGGVGSVGSVGAIGTQGNGARVVRPFDPFHSLAAIWSRNALDWRADEQEDS